MKDRIWALAVAMAAAGIPLSPAHAACEGFDLEGRWDAYAIGAAFGPGYWQRCSLDLNERGLFRDGSSCRDDGGDKSDLSGRLSLSSSCRLRGSLRQDSDDSSKRCDIRGTLSVDKQIVSGVGECRDGDIFLFNMVSR
jgi:hypothetical protein